MENLFISATATTPEIHFDCTDEVLLLRGESYPENAASFYSEIVKWAHAFTSSKTTEKPVIINVDLKYFNSSSTKMLFSLFDHFNEYAESGNVVVFNWHHHADDDTMFEFGQELKEDFSLLTFNDCVIKPS